jgi:hypothetical protein
VQLLWTYENSRVRIKLSDETATFRINATDSFWHLLNQPDGDAFQFSRPIFDFPNVWNRKNLFIHASFVTNTTAGYLGRDNEFYSKLSKIYQADSNPNFYFELSFDGMRKIELPYENFIVELAFILDDNSYDGS